MPIADLLNGLVGLIEKNPILEDELANSSTKANMLRTSGLRRIIHAGLKMLSDEGWVSEEQLKLLTNRLWEIKY